jgi:hypothetical protein
LKVQGLILSTGIGPVIYWAVKAFSTVFHTGSPQVIHSSIGVFAKLSTIASTDWFGDSMSGVNARHS